MKYVIADIRFDWDPFHTYYESAKDLVWLGSLFKSYIDKPIMEFNSLREANDYLSSLNPNNDRVCIIMSIEEAFKYEKDLRSL